VTTDHRGYGRAVSPVSIWLLRLDRIIGQPGATTFSSDTSGSNGH
jgi:hypothetical protein